MKLAKTLLETLLPKWNPAEIPHINPNAPENEPKGIHPLPNNRCSSQGYLLNLH
jgi:hypothetical protein